MKDSQGNNYEEIEFLNGKSSGKLRLTDVPLGWSDTRCIRIQVVTEEGKLHKGPEIPIETIPDFLSALGKILI